MKNELFEIKKQKTLPHKLQQRHKKLQRKLQTFTSQARLGCLEKSFLDVKNNHCNTKEHSN